MRSFMTAALKIAATTMMTPLIKKLFEVLGKYLTRITFKTTVKATTTTYALIVGSLFFMVIVILNLWVQSRVTHPTGSDVLWLVFFSLQLAACILLSPYLIGRSVLLRRKAQELANIEKQKDNLESWRVGSVVITPCDKTPSCITWSFHSER